MTLPINRVDPTENTVFEILFLLPDESKVFLWLGAAFWKQFRYFHPYLYRVFIDAINGNLVNSLLGITIEIQMKEDEYVVIVRFPNRFCPIFYTG